MGRFHRKTAPGVRDGRVQRTNNWRRSPSIYVDPQPRLVIDRRPPGPGHRHLLLRRDVERFVRLIPNWAAASAGLEVIALDRARPGLDGWYDRGVIGLPAWPLDRLHCWRDILPEFLHGHRSSLARLGVAVRGDEENAEVFWTPATARAYQLCHVFLHELGHHVDRMSTRTRRDNGPRGEGFADEYAFELEAAVLERYFEEFGLPD